MKTKRSVSLSALALFALGACFAGCNTSDDRSSGVPLEPNERASTPAEVKAVLDPVASARAEDYVTTDDTLRVMGIEHGDDTLGTYALVSNTKTWATTRVLVGDALGRNQRVSKVDENGIVLVGANGVTATLARGQDVHVTRVLHKYDRVVRYQGKNVFTYSPRIAGELAARGAGVQTEPVTVLPEPGVKLVSVDARLEAAALGFQVGDILLAINDQEVTGANVDALLGKFSTGEQMTVRMYREGQVRSVTYKAP